LPVFLYGISVFDSHSEMVRVNILANEIQEADPSLVLWLRYVYRYASQIVARL